MKRVLYGMMVVSICAATHAAAKGKVQWTYRPDALHLANDRFESLVVASCATVPEGSYVWAYCAWREQGSSDNYASLPKGYFDCKTNDANGECTIKTQAHFEKNYEGTLVKMTEMKLVREMSVNVECEDTFVKRLLEDDATRKLVRRLRCDDMPGNGSLGQYTKEGTGAFEVEFNTYRLMIGYERVGTEEDPNKKDITIALQSWLHTWLVWHVLNGKPAAAGAQHVKKRYCGRNGAQYELYECRQTGGLQAAARVAEGEAAAMGAIGPVQNTGVALSLGTASSSDVTGGKVVVGPSGPLVPAPPPVEPADEPGYGWVKIGTLPSDVYYTSTAP